MIAVDLLLGARALQRQGEVVAVDVAVLAAGERLGDLPLLPSAAVEAVDLLGIADDVGGDVAGGDGVAERFVLLAAEELGFVEGEVLPPAKDLQVGPKLAVADPGGVAGGGERAAEAPELLGRGEVRVHTIGERAPPGIAPVVLGIGVVEADGRVAVGVEGGEEEVAAPGQGYAVGGLDAQRRLHPLFIEAIPLQQPHRRQAAAVEGDEIAAAGQRQLGEVGVEPGVILALLENRDRHGYEISKRIEERSGGRLQFHVASLYPMLYRLQDREWIEGRWVEKPGQRRRRYYRLTAQGRRALASQRSDWREFFSALDQVAGFRNA